MSEPARDREPFAVYWTREEWQTAVDAYIGERVSKLQRALRRAEKERDELRVALHSGGTPLRPSQSRENRL